MRIISPKEYAVIEHMVKEGLISGLPFSEGTQYTEFLKRLAEINTDGNETVGSIALRAWHPEPTAVPFFGTDRSQPTTRATVKPTLWQRVKAAYYAFLER